MKKLLLIFSLLITPIIIYFFISFLLLLFPFSSSQSNIKNKTIYLYHSLTHTEIIFKKSDLPQTFLDTFQPKRLSTQKGYLAFSYGDQSFMFNISSWKDIQLKIALPALFLNTPAVIQVGHYNGIKQDASVIKIYVSEQSFKKLQNNILHTFAYDKHMLKKINYSHQRNYLYYYRAKRAYNLFYTCNTWTGEILRHANIPISYWTPLAYQVVYGFL